MTNFTPLRALAFSALLQLALFALPLHAQEVDTPREQPDFPTVAIETLELTSYRPEHTHTGELGKLARRLFGRSFFVEDEGNLQGGPVQNIQELGDSLLLVDNVERTDFLLTRLHKLDKLNEGLYNTQMSASSAYIEANWSPRYISIPEAHLALGSYSRLLEHAGRTPNIISLVDSNVLLLRDTSENIAVMQTVLEKLDAPAPELMLSAMVIEGRMEPSTYRALPLPEELTQNLAQLMPYEHFETLSVGMVRSSTRVSDIELSMPGRDSTSYQLQLQPRAFDAQTGSLSAEIRFESRDGRSFRTNTSLPLNEYTVIGAAGRTPLFVVLKLTPVSGEMH